MSWEFWPIILNTSPLGHLGAKKNHLSLTGSDEADVGQSLMMII